MFVWNPAASLDEQVMESDGNEPVVMWKEHGSLCAEAALKYGTGRGQDTWEIFSFFTSPLS